MGGLIPNHFAVMSATKPKAKSTYTAPASQPSTSAVALVNDNPGDESYWLAPVLKFGSLGLICLLSFAIRCVVAATFWPPRRGERLAARKGCPFCRHAHVLLP